MVVTRVLFQVDVDSHDNFVDQLNASVPKYQGLDGLIRKYYVVADDRKSAGGIYLWESREKAEAWYSPDWKSTMTEVWGEPPLLEYLDCPIVVDNS